jgi:quercetin dioxygenase-like cupin family protein
MGKLFTSGATMLATAFTATLTAQTGSVYVNDDAVDGALASGGVLVDRPQVRVSGGHRNTPAVLDSQKGTTILYITGGDATFIAGTLRQRLVEGDVLVVPAGTTQSIAAIAAPISYLQVMVPVLANDAKAAEVVHIPAERVSATMKKAAPLADGPNLRVSGGHRPYASRDASPVAEVHANEADLFFVVGGRATQMLGGNVVEGKTTGPGQIRGPKTEGGRSYQLDAGDVMWVPAGMPHWFPEISEALSYLLVKVFY